jgi:hypothetical protein
MLPQAVILHGEYAARVGRCAALILVCTAAAFLCACQPSSRGARSGTSPSTELSVNDWPFVPASIRVHPLSRITVDAAGRRRVELRIECRDVEGDSVRTIGLVSIRVGEAEAIEEALDLSSLRVNQESWDRVTRTYRQTLDVPEGFVCKPGGKMPVKLDLRLSEDRVLSATGDITCQ